MYVKLSMYVCMYVCLQISWGNYYEFTLFPNSEILLFSEHVFELVAQTLQSSSDSSSYVPNYH